MPAVSLAAIIWGSALGASSGALPLPDYYQVRLLNKSWIASIGTGSSSLC